MLFANLIVIGGPIAVGKSTLIDALPYPKIFELDETDIIQMLLLENTYTKGRVNAEVIENYFLQKRKIIYNQYSNTLQLHVLDRSIFESLWFAKGNMNNKSYKHFEKFWESEIIDLIKTSGKPKLYILLTMSWKTFKNRIFTRGREVEIKNFSQNENFFRKHIREYEDHMINVFKKFNINYLKIKTDNVLVEDILSKTLDVIKGISNE